METTNKKFECYLPVFHGFYGSYWDDVNFEGEAEHYNLPQNFPFYDYFNYKAYQNELAKVFCNEVEKYMPDFISNVKYLELDSPKYYNFENDKIAIEVDININVVKQYIYDNKKAFEQYLSDHHKSRDGFISFYNHTFEEWIEYTNDFTDYTKEGYVCLTSILRFIAEQEQITDEIFYEAAYSVNVGEYYNNDFYKIVNLLESVQESKFVNVHLLSEYLSKKYNDIDFVLNINEVINQIIDFTRQNYQNNDVVNLALEQFNEQDYICIDEQIIDVLSIVESTINEIDNQTLKLEL